MPNKWFVKTRDKKKFALVLDVGTTGIKAFVFDAEGNIVAKENRKIDEISLHPGHVEQDPIEIIKLSEDVLRSVVKESGLGEKDFIGLGISNQRETTVVWDKKSSWPFYPAIVWKDSRTKNYCDAVGAENNNVVQAKTGLTIQPYFSASKMQWLFENIPEVKFASDKNCLGMGTVDTWLLWNLTEDRSYLTDETNAARTLIFNIKTKQWDKDLLNIFSLAMVVLPDVKPSRSNFGKLKKHPHFSIKSRKFFHYFWEK